MSGLAGILRLDGQPSISGELGGMAMALAHRGPDGIRLWEAPGVGLAQLSLVVTPESRYETGAVTRGAVSLVADVRLDNRDELLALLDLRSPAARPATDPELLVAAYERWGSQCADRLVGAFAFAVWDGRERRLVLVRDHFGVKPLVYAHVPGRLFAFASEPKALLEVEGVSAALDDLAVAEHLLVPVREDLERTIFRDVRSVPPAHVLMATAGGVRAYQYWSLDPEREVRLGSDGEYVEAFRERFAEAVQCRLRSATPVSSMLSGGMDSSSIASVAAQLEGPLPTYSAVFPATPASDESDYIDAVVTEHDLPSYRFVATDESPLAHLEAIQWHTDRPLTGGNTYLGWHLYAAAAAAGSRVVLDGFDGDTTVSHGLGYFFELRSRGRYLALAREVGAFARQIGEPWHLAVWSWLRGPVLQATGVARARHLGRAGLRYLRDEAGEEPSLPLWRRLLDEEFARRITDDLQTPSAKPVLEREQHYSRIVRPLMTRVNEAINGVAAAAETEVRLPFFDKRLVEFCLALPPDQKLRGGLSRFILREALSGVLPDKVRLRGGKTSIQPSFDRGLRHFERQRLATLAPPPGGALAQYLQPSTVRELSSRFVSGAGGSKENVTLWRSLSLDCWLQREPYAARTLVAEALAPEPELRVHLGPSV